ncbi:coatomer subunit epsilon [Trichophyton equinum CBS 127.97]|uniref:Coatomer subunit epsilon n=1 Tax=Trichophyton equinum (strain ATCC MYA-4606 / CBS 127.97) TaxID=559882 RepID=F2PXK1_TRIEC|nr:coatomer subunit epsilon [Trichophyton equinum CBS 127.97]
MDPFTAEGELLNIHNAFYQGQYQEVVDFDTSSFSSENTLAARVLKLRAQIALGQSKEVLKSLGAKRDTPELDAVAALAQHVSGSEEEALKLAEDLAAKHEDNAAVQVLAGQVLHAQDKTAEALALLSKHSGNLEAVALIVQIHLQQNRSDLALKEVQAARRWAQDSLLVNLAESWVGMRVGGEKYQAAFYVYEELASVPSTTSALSIVGQAVSELHLGRLPEAEAALQSALQKYPEDPQVLANSIVLNAIIGKDKEELIERLRKVQPDHAFLTDLKEKSDLFDTAAAKYPVKA